MINYVIIGGLAVLVCVLTFYAVHIRAAVSRYHVSYVDTAGISQNPPVFLELEQGKTLNIKIDKRHYLSVQHFSFFENLFYVEKIQVLYNALLKFMRDIRDLQLTDTTRKQKEIMIYGLYVEIGKLVYKICKARSKKWGFRQAFWKRYLNDTDWAYQITEEMIRFWLFTKKKLEMLPVAISDPRILGERHLWNSLEMDTQGNFSQRPRFGFSLN